MKNKNLLFALVVFLVLSFGCFYVLLPALTIQSYSSLIIFGAIIAVSYFIYIVGANITKPLTTVKLSFKASVVIGVVIVVAVVGGFIYSPIFMSSTYAKRIDVTDGNFKEDIPPVDLNNLPLLDKSSTEKVGDRVMGQLPELISQFSVSEQYTQISYNGRLVRVTPLEYNGFFKWFGNRNEGIPGYIMVDSTTGEASLIKLPEGMKYAASGFFNDNLQRHIRFQYPTELLSTSVFEIDDEGNPYYVTPVLKVKWIEMLPDIKGAILTNPIDGSSTYYDVADVPKWVDHVYPASLVIEQANSWGSYQDGWLNSFIGQKNVRTTTQGYTYLADDTDIFVYTGITSATADQSNIGFILINLRTKDTKFYAVPGAEEFSAMASAQGAVQEKGYISTFPLLINLDNRPTYLSSLKDSAGLVKAYAFVDVQDYQKVKVTDSNLGLVAAAKSYLQMLGANSGEILTGQDITGIITDIQNVVIDGNSYYYLTLQNDEIIYKAIITLDDRLPFIHVGDKISFSHSDGVIITVNTVDRVTPQIPVE
ncbi:MAG: CvpA family protein [Anaerorhabdus sp.]|uniref:CvpA family protein n=1 Tax=Anaerorhabdus sp. TaxID=1872524 RepID=UPI003A869BD7